MLIWGYKKTTSVSSFRFWVWNNRSTDANPVIDKWWFKSLIVFLMRRRAAPLSLASIVSLRGFVQKDLTLWHTMPHPTYLLLPGWPHILTTRLRETQKWHWEWQPELTLSEFCGGGQKTSKPMQAGEGGREGRYLRDAIVSDRPRHRDGGTHPTCHLARVQGVSKVN